MDTESVRARLGQLRRSTSWRCRNSNGSAACQGGAGTAQSLNSAVANRDVADSSLRMLQIELEKSVVKAPFDGVVDAVLVDQDEFVDIGTPMVRMVQVHR